MYRLTADEEREWARRENRQSIYGKTKVSGRIGRAFVLFLSKLVAGGGI